MHEGERVEKPAKLLLVEYATFRPDILRDLCRLLPEKRSVVLDPMAGAATLLPFLQVRGHTAYMADLDPVHLHVNRIRRFEVYRTYSKTGRGEILTRLRDCGPELARASRREVVTDRWIDDATLEGLVLAWHRTASSDGNVRLLLRGLLLLSVRPLAACAKSSNPTWLKPGGWCPGRRVGQVFEEQIKRLEKYYAAAYRYADATEVGSAVVALEDARRVRINPRAHVVVTSPPYCNRLDYDVLYGPEHYLLSALDEPLAAGAMIGTNLVRGYGRFEEDFDLVCAESRLAARLLKGVRETQIRHERTSNYYVKYFTRYFASLFGACENMARNVRAGGRLVLVLQNNAHRGQLIDLRRIVEQFLRGKGWEVSLAGEWERTHQGLQHVSRRHRLVSPMHVESILVATR